MHPNISILLTNECCFSMLWMYNYICCLSDDIKYNNMKRKMNILEKRITKLEQNNIVNR